MKLITILYNSERHPTTTQNQRPPIMPPIPTGAPDPGTPDPGIPRLPVIGLSSPLMSDLGFCTVSSIDRIKQAASDAAVMALIRTTAGSHTNASKLSEISSFMTSTPYHLPSVACF